MIDSSNSILYVILFSFVFNQKELLSFPSNWVCYALLEEPLMLMNSGKDV